jgi:hypothetical protein
VAQTTKERRSPQRRLFWAAVENRRSLIPEFRAVPNFQPIQSCPSRRFSVEFFIRRMLVSPGASAIQSHLLYHSQRP